MAASEPLRLLIAAMGGEGGGVLAGWITEAAVASGLWVQRTSVPGVAQRTGATTYYLEFLLRESDDRPVMGLQPAPGRVDVLLATELLEAARMVQAGFVTPDRTHLVASTHRVYTVDEKSAMADGRLPQVELAELCQLFASSAQLADLSAIAAAEGCHLNAVLLGALAGSKTLPIPEEAFRQAVDAGGRAVDANLRGFEAGLRLGTAAESQAPAPAPLPANGHPLAAQIRAHLPEPAWGIADEGVKRLMDFQDEAYARLYLERLRRVAGRPGAGAELIRELARHLAVRMSFEDTVRVAQLKLRQARLARVEAEARARSGDIVDVTEFLKPGPEEMLGLLPPRLARRLLAAVERRGWGGVALPMRVRTTRLSGFLRLKALAALRRWRPKSLRYAEEQEWIEEWLGLVERSLKIDPRATLEVVETAKLVRGYGDTYKRGRRNWRIVADRVIAPSLAGHRDPSLFADAVTQARHAALADPDGDALERTIEDFERLRAMRQAAE